jgi:uncharacterized protein YneF (UPF0154 family)
MEAAGILVWLIICLLCILLGVFIGMMICNKQEL